MNDILEYKGYYGSIHYSSNDEVFHGKLLAINDLVNFEGVSVAELKSAFQEAVDDYLETCKELGKEPDKTYKGSFNVRIPTSLHREAAVIAARKNISLNDFVKYALKSTIEKEKKASTEDQYELAD
jgi:predicted HicB family RNase H-like nuclease